MQRTTSSIGVWFAGRQATTGTTRVCWSRQVATSSVGAVATLAQPLILTHFGCGFGSGSLPMRRVNGSGSLFDACLPVRVVKWMGILSGYIWKSPLDAGCLN
ncbi:hypothetical protein HMPREF9080_00598 [Cardiobacterium valvarum F0432]|uniref:Uncharacterized protein n=1 Tax=Cardiobacterium valvarum F0432 TaxID=797473 RepID=G9ZCW9_9GAMM|nr:hypothetical protein HMPREF9080_00598 [Cardiobacterium valvarum F0432]